MENKIAQEKIYGFSHIHKEGFSYYLSFFIWPFGVTLAALRHWKSPWSKNVFWLFCIFFGFAFIIAEEGGADSDRYARLFIQYAHSHLNIGELFDSFYKSGSNYLDIASPLLTYLVSRFTVNPSVLFAVFGLIFGYFYSRNIWYILERLDRKITGIIFIYIITFILLNPIWNINGFRMWTAAQIFLFGALPYLLEGNRKRLLWAGFSIFFHFSFFYPFGILMLYILLRNRLNIYMGFFIVTAFIKEIDLIQVRSALMFLPEIFHRKIINYTNPQYAELIDELHQIYNSWYFTLSDDGLRWVIYLLAIFVFVFGRNILKEKKGLTKLFCFSLLLYGFANLSSLVPGGARFITIASTFMFAFFIMLFNAYPEMKGLLLVLILSMPFIFLFCAVNIRAGMDYYGLMLIFGNPIIAALPIEQSPLIIGIKKLIL